MGKRGITGRTAWLRIAAAGTIAIGAPTLGAVPSALPVFADANEAPPATPAAVHGAISAGEAHTCAIVDAGFSCWGSDLFGELGNGAVTGDIAGPTLPVRFPEFPLGDVVALSAGSAHTCALGSLFPGLGVTCWGSDATGQLGNGAATGNVVSPGPALTMPVTAEPTAVSAGQEHTCVLLDTGQVSCWGGDFSGQLGNGAAAGVVAAPPPPVTLPGGVRATAISAGAFHTCALLSSGQVTCWGENGDGQLGNGNTSDVTSPPTPVVLPGGATATAISAGNSHTCAVLSSGQVTCWGNDLSGQLGNGPASSADVTSPPPPITLPAAATSVSAGRNHTCARLVTGDVSCWGSDFRGQIGNGDAITVNAASPFTIGFAVGAKATAVTVGDEHSCALLVVRR
jgi:alpha-tubulin suppressor-like RCC1 family protein